MVVRWASHLTVWICVLIPLIVVLSRGWQAIGDDAAIAIRAHQSLSSNPPLVGMVSTAGDGLGHYLFDPGPLLFWLLAVPVHIDPARGLLWGAALWWGVALSLAIEAIWSTRMWLGCAAVAFVAADLLWASPRVLEDPSWNAYFPIPFFVAALVLAWVVGTGSFGWWPVLVVVASVAAQCHLIFTIPAVLLTVVSPLVGLVVTGRPGRLRWLVVGVGVGAVCWMAPLLQNLDGNGNLSALANTNHAGKAVGLGFGLQILADAGAPLPIWLQHEPQGFFPVFGFIGDHSSALGVIVLCVLAVIGVAAAVTRRRALLVLSIVGLVTSLSLVATFAIFPKKNLFSLDYLIIMAWVVGFVVWAVVLWAVVALATVVVRTARPGVGDVGSSAGGVVRRWPAATVAVGVVVIGVLAGFATAGIRAASALQPALDTVGWNHQTVRQVRQVTAAIERSVPRGPVVYSVDAKSASALTPIWITEGVAYQLEVDGYQPGLFSVERAYTQLAPHRGAPSVQVVLGNTTVLSVQRTH
jgi:hypothetical protein